VTAVQRLAGFACARSWDALRGPARDALKIRVLDAIGCALGAWGRVLSCSSSKP
jgi:hypothetical protein